jgi:ABC-type multidrug transport system ATPase subunit
MNVSREERQRIVEDLILELGLTSCADVKVGNAFIKGISGGERKRTSIGVELITNPSIIFLDEPTTGLDSTTALQVILLLKTLAKQGKTVISTIHQPSS